jgi:molybdopterin synthase catalytic subunit
MIAQPRYYIEITRDVLDLKKLYDQCVTEDTGGIDVFIGTVRDHFDGKQVTSIDYHGYPEMAEKFLQEIVERAFEQWKINRIAIQHRLGLLQLREASVIIVVAASHREEAFTACRFIIEEIKKDLPIWKKEFFASGEVAWKAEPFHPQK